MAIVYLSSSLQTRTHSALIASCLPFTQCDRATYMSGTAEACDGLERDVQDTRVLAFDGSFTQLLVHLITPFATIPGVA